MASLSSKVRQYCADNGVAEVDFTVDVLLQDDSNGQGPYIREWNVSGVAQPTDEQLNAVDSAADLSERQNAVRATRRSAYGDLGDQLDMQYHDSVDGTSTWKDHVAKVKTDNPIPTE
jgi:hypothetical protein